MEKAREKNEGGCQCVMREEDVMRVLMRVCDVRMYDMRMWCENMMRGCIRKCASVNRRKRYHNIPCNRR